MDKNSYFYIIEHIPSGRRYAGSRWKNGCHPSELLQENGYKTSSCRVSRLISSDGLESFSVVLILHQKDINKHVYDYETEFLQTNQCAESDSWLNMHNNNRPPPYGTDAYRGMMLEKYGVDHNGKIPGMRERMTQKMKDTLSKNPDIAKNRMTCEVRQRISVTSRGKKKSSTENYKGRPGRRSAEELSMLSKIMTRTNLEKNAMNNRESRAKVGASKVGRKRIYRNDGSFYMSPRLG